MALRERGAAASRGGSVRAAPRRHLAGAAANAAAGGSGSRWPHWEAARRSEASRGGGVAAGGSRRWRGKLRPGVVGLSRHMAPVLANHPLV